MVIYAFRLGGEQSPGTRSFHFAQRVGRLRGRGAGRSLRGSGSRVPSGVARFSLELGWPVSGLTGRGGSFQLVFELEHFSFVEFGNETLLVRP